MEWFKQFVAKGPLLSSCSITSWSLSMPGLYCCAQWIWHGLTTGMAAQLVPMWCPMTLEANFIRYLDSCWLLQTCVFSLPSCQWHQKTKVLKSLHMHIWLPVSGTLTNREVEKAKTETIQMIEAGHSGWLFDQPKVARYDTMKISGLIRNSFQVGEKELLPQSGPALKARGDLEKFMPRRCKNG